MCSSTSGYNKECEEECENFKCFKLLLSQLSNFKEFTKNTLTYGFGIMQACVRKQKYHFVKYLIDNNEKLGLHIDFSKERGAGNENVLMAANYVEKNHKIIKLLLESNIVNVNHISDNGSIIDEMFKTAASRKDKMMNEYPLQSDLYQYLNMLLSNKNINTRSVNFVGNNCLGMTIHLCLCCLLSFVFGVES